MQSMNGEDWKGLLALIPPDEVGTFVLVLSSGHEICLDAIVRAEEKYIVVRGRLAGQIDEGRGFFVPLDNLVYLRWEKLVKMDELKAVLDKKSKKPIEPEKELDADAGPPTELLPRPPLPPLQQAAEVAPANSAVARNNLLERIRAARASSSR
jgi:hypothetical protein